jgi:hypothetical protein
MEPDMERVVTPMIAGRRPVDARLAGRADDLFGLPVDNEGGKIESLARLSLPTDL